jgi:ubiquinone/menaquinone biosynthesis C-methylase UbiE
MNDPFTQVAEAFSRKSVVYDDFGVNHANLQRMRAKVRQHVLEYLHPGDRILELNAGTGGDALFFTRLGYPVHAIDLSPGMVAQIQAKAAENGCQDLLTVQLCSFTDLDQVACGPFHTIFSNMGGVNCISDLGRITQRLERLLIPGGFITWVVMPPVCLWELSQALRGRFRTAFRRLAPGGVLANVEGVQFQTYYFHPKKVRLAFGPHYHPVALQGLSVFTPPADHKEFSSRHPRLYRFLCALDNRLADLTPFNAWGDFYILTLRYQPGNP